jgi:PAS domain-containing protein
MQRSGHEESLSRHPASNAELEKRDAYYRALFRHSPIETMVVDREGRIVEYNAAKERRGDRLPRVGEVMYRDYARKHTIDMHAELLACMRDGTLKTYPAMRYGAKTLAITIAPFPGGAIIASEDITEAKRAEAEMIALIDQLRGALREIQTLRELLPICASCKRIRDDKGYWQGVEGYLSQRTNIDFSHTMCPECMQRLYPDIVQSQ